MNLELFQYTVAGLRAFELYPFSKMTKRYFRGFRQNQPDILYRIIIYPHLLVKVDPLVKTLKTLKAISNSLLGKIISIYEETQLVHTGQKQEIQTVIAVILEDESQGQFISIFDFLIQFGHVSQILSRDFTFKLVKFIKQMKALGFSNCFNPSDLLIERATGQIKFDNYGDYPHFLFKQQIFSDIWQLGSLIFTLLKGNPPYNRKALNDPHYVTLYKGHFQKFWGIFAKKSVKQPSQCASKFLQACFDKQSTIQKIQSLSWFQDHIPMTNQQKMQQFCTMVAAKEQKKAAKVIQQRNRTDKINQALRERSCLLQKRETNQLFIQTFLDYFLLQEDKMRPFTKNNEHQQTQQKSKAKIAQLLTILKLNENKNIKIYDIRDNKNAITFKIKTELEDNISIDSEVQLQIQKLKGSVSFVCKRIEASPYEGMWINNYIKQLYTQG